MHRSIPTVTIPPLPPPGQPPGQSRPLWPRGGEFCKYSCPGGRGGDNLRAQGIMRQKCRRSTCWTQQADFFAEKSLHFVRNWLEENNLSKLKPVFEAMKPKETRARKKNNGTDAS